MERWNHRTPINHVDRDGDRGDSGPIECHTVDQPFGQFNPRVAERRPPSGDVPKPPAARLVVLRPKIRLDR
ncbi:MAG: hypothetical protein ACKO38_09205 [Planctomycetota bacterium]